MTAAAIAATGMEAMKKKVEVLAHNLANVNTDGYKRNRAEFKTQMYQDYTGVGTATSSAGTLNATGVQIGLGVALAGTTRIMEQGAIQITENPLDVMIQGEGFLTVQLPSGEAAYTRDGAMRPDAQGTLTTRDGFKFSPDITIPINAEELYVNTNGEVYAKVTGQIEPQLLGQLELVKFPNNAGLRAIGDNLLMATQASGPPVQGVAGTEGFGTIFGGGKEASNVKPVREITALIEAEQAHQLNSRTLDTASKMMSVLPGVGK
ncbi:MAG: flagellar basal-body rod protein FlgG [Alphaproteobacteria bacterium]